MMIGTSNIIDYAEKLAREAFKKINSNKKITNGELHAYVRSNVIRQAIKLGREQTPEFKGDLNKVLVEVK